MATLTKYQIIEHLKKGELIINAFKNENGEFDVEPASYDLRAGTIIWKETKGNTGKVSPETKFYDPTLDITKQERVTLNPGQVMFVITHEEVKMPNYLCGTVYAKNKFSREGILALTTGHIDPGVQCPIVIRLINLRSIPYTFHLGEPIYTIVFHKVEIEKGQKLVSHNPISKELTFTRTIESANTALGNALHDLSFTHEFVRKDEMGDVLWSLIKNNFLKTSFAVVTILAAIAGIISGIVTLINYFRKP